MGYYVDAKGFQGCFGLMKCSSCLLGPKRAHHEVSVIFWFVDMAPVPSSV